MFCVLCEQAGTTSRRAEGYGRETADCKQGSHVDSHGVNKRASRSAVSVCVPLMMVLIMDITRFADRKMRLMVFALIFTTLGKYCHVF